jgi:hypothetical protein
METIPKLLMRGYLEGNDAIRRAVAPFMEVLSKPQVRRELLNDMDQSITRDMQVLNAAMPLISSQRKVAQNLGQVVDGAPSLRKYTVVGSRRAVYCTKHCGPKSTFTRGYQYAYIDDDGKHCLTDPLCEKCVRELSDPKNRGRLAQLLGLAKRKDGKRRQSVPKQDRSPRVEKTEPEVDSGKSADPEAPVRLDANALSDMTVSELRELAKSQGISPIPRRKLDLLTSIIQG